MAKRERGLWELYETDPEKADAELWGRKPERVSRRGFLRQSGLTAMALALGAVIPFARRMPSGLLPAGLAEAAEGMVIPGKDGLRVLSDRPLNAETPPHLLDDDFTPNNLFFVRNNGLPPGPPDNPGQWELTVDGEVHQSLRLTLDHLKTRFKPRTLALQLECGGNGRAGFNPPAKGGQWTFGAIGCARYTGAPLAEVLRAAGLKDSAVYTGYYGRDLHLSGDPGKTPISRGTPVSKAMDEHTLLAWDMNGQPLPALHGFPLRLVSPGWPGSVSPKWLRRIFIRDRVHDGNKMDHYRVPKFPLRPGAAADEENMVIIESLPVKSLITHPKSGAKWDRAKPLTLRGQAWAGERSVAAVHLSCDFGATWQEAVLHPPVNRYAWQRWRADFQLPSQGYYEIWARATDDAGVMQPMVVPGWNPEGYKNNAMHRIAITAV